MGIARTLYHALRSAHIRRRLETESGPRDLTYITDRCPIFTRCSFRRRSVRRNSHLGRDFDPVKVGVDTTGNSGKFLYDTTLVGNSNAGHSFENGPGGNGIIGPLLTDEERWALIEYLKSIPGGSGPHQLPFGGPPNATTGHVKWEGPTGKD